MQLTKYKVPVPSLFSHRDEFVTGMDRIFNEVFGDMFPATSKELGGDIFSKGAYPKVNVIDEEKQVTIEAEVPGISKDQLVVDVNHDEKILTIKGEKRTTEQNERKGTYLYRELKQSSFSRSFTLNDNLDAEAIKAKFENGVLVLTIPKKIPEPKTNQIKQVQIE